MMVLTYILFTIFLLEVFSELIVLFFPLHYDLKVPDKWPKVSVLLVVRNEEENLHDCISSLLNLDYPDFEVWVADDDSKDRTPEIIGQFITDPRFNVLEKPVKVKEGQNPKAVHLEELTMKASGKIIAVTDGDCVYPSKWLKTLVAHMGNRKMMSGVTGIRGSRMEDLEWKINIGRIAILSRLGFNTSGVGNNMIADRESVLSVGGWKAVSTHLTEDFALHRLFYKNKLATGILFHPDVLIQSLSTPLKKRFIQRKRWMLGVKDLQFPTLFMVYLQSFLFPAMVAGVLIFGKIGLAAVSIYIFLNLLSNLKLLVKIQHRNIVNLIPYQVYTLLWNFVFLCYQIFSRRVHWKGRNY